MKKQMTCCLPFIFLKKIETDNALFVKLDTLSTCLVFSMPISRKLGGNLPSVFSTKQPIFQPIVYLKIHETQHTQLNKPTCSFKFAKIWSKNKKKINMGYQIFLSFDLLIED
jgi:hypothetical protein